jgi:hypothetical protein
MNFKNKSSVGCSGLQVTILKACYKQVVPFLTKLFNDCIDNGMFVKKWKNAKVTPLHKKGASDDFNNYRGIPVLPIAAKYYFQFKLSNISHLIIYFQNISVFLI